MIEPKMGPHDIHVVTDGAANKEKIFDAAGKLLHTFDVFPHGINGPRQDVTGGDTVAQLYLLGKPIYTQEDEDWETVRRPYGWGFIPMGDYEGREAALGRAGFGDHGGGHEADAWEPDQELTYTLGCCRHKNKDWLTLAKLVDSVQATGGNAWQSVYQ